MSNNNFFREPFDDGTKVKLEIFQKYLQAWLPTFIKAKNTYWKDIYIYDFFAGEGKDSEGNLGSSLIIIKELKNYSKTIVQKKLKITVLFNELNKKKLNELKGLVEEIEPAPPYNIVYKNKDFRILFEELYPKMKLSKDLPRLVFIDQFGIKYVTKDLFTKLNTLLRTDLMFFISSSFVRRFNRNTEFRKYIEIKEEEFTESRPVHSHRIICNYYKSLVKKDTDYFIAPFSIKKKSNIYGLIFGSSHSFGIEKFLKVCWNINENTGDANYNIDEENIADGVYSLFPEDNRPKKLQYFEQILEKNILNKTLQTNRKIYYFAFNYECLPKHANVVIRKLIKNKKIKPVKTTAQKIHRLKEERIEILK